MEGGLDQAFHLEIFVNQGSSDSLLLNQTTKEYPFFTTHALPAGHSFVLNLYSSNSKVFINDYIKPVHLFLSARVEARVLD